MGSHVLNGDGNNVPFSDGLKLEKRFYTCPLKMPLKIFKRCCGPEDDMKFIINEIGFNNRVQAISERLKSGWDMPPLIINFENGKFELRMVIIAMKHYLKTVTMSIM
jgi:hypothetical protein